MLTKFQTQKDIFLFVFCFNTLWKAREYIYILKKTDAIRNKIGI